ncbi:hypothetical protein HSRCO_1768 [Halanaeroarchaeum sp. HSR-CO]|uniref:hypothetical protein n=1 Tax=Halanaeroarchaeum sp. HSR-CO TaxID=2866382 RepID=UPI00217E2061|nr:hypothetical protein [Halanaeroarchaeum sp. HSR-CO]UWG48046.1 hypothetical protein HSRCO_1768 [Halanaeroarchaeum sp. HSR-CO]
MGSMGSRDDEGDVSRHRIGGIDYSRRSVVGALGSVILVGTAGCATTVSAQSTAQMDSRNAEVTTPDGSVDEIVIPVMVDCEYSGFTQAEVTHQGFTLAIDEEIVDDGTWSIEHPDFLGELGPDAGDFTYRSFFWKVNDWVPVFEETSYTQEDFYVDEGESETYDFDIDVEWRIVSDEEVLRTESLSETVSITIHHESSGGDSGGDSPTATVTETPESGAASMETMDIRIYAEIDDRWVGQDSE